MSYDSTVLALSPTIYLKLDETSGTTASDSSGNGNNFTIPAATTKSQAACLSDGGYSMSSDGFGNSICYLSSVPAAISNPTAFSLVCWVYLASTSAKGCFMKVGASSTNGYALGVGNTTMDANGNNLIGLAEGLAWKASGAAIGTGNHMVALTRDASNWLFYIDGSLAATTGAQTITAAATETSVGGYNAGGTLRYLTSTARVDAAAFFPTKLTGTDISNLYAAGTTSPTTRKFAPVARRNRQPVIRAAHL